MNLETFMSITNEGYQSPSSCFLNFNETFKIYYGGPARLLIKFELESSVTQTKYLNAVYSLNVCNPIFKLYPSMSINGIEFVGNVGNSSYNITNEEKIKIDVIGYTTDWSHIEGLANKFMSVGNITKNQFHYLIGLGCVQASNKTITNSQHRSKLSASLFTRLAKEFRKSDIINFNSLIIYGFNEIEKNEIVSIYEKKLIYERILDDFLSI